MVVGFVKHIQSALKYRGGWKGLFELGYTVRIILFLLAFVIICFSYIYSFVFLVGNKMSESHM